MVNSKNGCRTQSDGDYNGRDEYHEINREYIKQVVDADDCVRQQDAVGRPLDVLAMIYSLLRYAKTGA
jgi:hypothetical protein